MTSHISCRLSEELGKQFDRAVAEVETNRSKLLRRAIRFYVRENPDGIGVFSTRREDESARKTDDQYQSPSEVYDPIADLQ